MAMAHERVSGRVMQVNMYALFSHGLCHGRVWWPCEAHSLFTRACDPFLHENFLSFPKFLNVIGLVPNLFQACFKVSQSLVRDNMIMFD